MRAPTIRPERHPVPQATPIVSYSPLVMEVPDRAAPLELRITAPESGMELPILLLSHGHGASNFLSSYRGYGPLADFYAAHGFVVIQPTHLSSATLALDTNGPEGALFWHSRPKDMRFIIDHLDEIAARVPFLSGRVDLERIAALGHSLGGHTVAMLAGMQVTHNVTGLIIDMLDPRIKAAVLIAAPGNGSDLATTASDRYPALKSTNFDTMTMPALVVVGDDDYSAMFSDRRDWRADAYSLSPAPKTLLTMIGAQHIFGGISGWDAKETADEDPQRVADLQRLTWSYLRSALYPQDNAWPTVIAELAASDTPLATVESK